MNLKNIIAITSLLIGFSIQANAQLNLSKAKDKLMGEKESSISESEAGSGIKEALNKGISKAVETVNVEDGYFKNPEIKIDLPEDAQVIQTKLKAVGLGKKVDDAVLSMNRAAELAAGEAKPIFVDAIKELSFVDAVKIVNGSDDEAATKYLDKTTRDQLTAKFNPIIKSSIEEVDATKYWNDMMGSYNKIPFVKKVNPDLEDYVTEKAIDGLLKMVAKEEKLIRTNPAARTTDLLQKVFK